MVALTIDERQDMAQESQAEVAKMWSGEQHITGPVIIIPYIEKQKDEDTGKTIGIGQQLILQPQILQINGNAACRTLHRGFYDAVVYNAALTLNGEFAQLENPIILSESENFQLHNAMIAVGISDLRGIEEKIEIEWNGRIYPTRIISDGTCFKNGVCAQINLSE